MLMHRLLVLSLVLLLGCGTTPPPDTSDAQTAPASAEPVASAPTPPPRPIETIEPGQRVPSFDVETVDGKILHSREIIGRKPFVVLHFASWCPVCAKKLPIVKAALDRLDKPILVIGVAWDEDETWDKVADYVANTGIDMELVRAKQQKRFAIGYDPFGGFPLVLVIHPNGIIAEFQMGLKADHEEKLDVTLKSVLEAPM